MDGIVLQEEDFSVDGQASYADTLREALQRPHPVEYHYDLVEIIAEEQNTIVPLDQFRKGDMVAFYRLCFPDAQLIPADMQYQLLPSLEVVMLFRLASDLLRTVSERYPDVKVRCADGEQLEQMAVTQRQAEERTDKQGNLLHDFYVSVSPTRTFFVLFSGASLVYAASQPAKNDNDRLYLLLGIWKAFSLDAEQDCCHLLAASPGLLESTKEYILNVTTE